MPLKRAEEVRMQMSVPLLYWVSGPTLSQCGNEKELAKFAASMLSCTEKVISP